MLTIIRRKRVEEMMYTARTEDYLIKATWGFPPPVAVTLSTSAPHGATSCRERRVQLKRMPIRKRAQTMLRV